MKIIILLLLLGSAFILTDLFLVSCPTEIPKLLAAFSQPNTSLTLLTFCPPRFTLRQSVKGENTVGAALVAALGQPKAAPTVPRHKEAFSHLLSGLVRRVWGHKKAHLEHWHCCLCRREVSCVDKHRQECLCYPEGKGQTAI